MMPWSPLLRILRGGILISLLLATAASADSLHSIRLPTQDIVYDARTRRLYASVPSRTGSIGNSIVAIDPETGAVVASVWVGSEPGKLALSDNGRYLYVALDGASGIRRVDLPELSAGPQFPLAVSGFLGLEVVWDMEVQPGHPEVLAVLTRHPGVSGLAGLSVYDHGARRPRALPGYLLPNAIAFSRSPSRLFGLTPERGGRFFEFEVDLSGVSVAREIITGPIYSYGMELDNGRIYSPFGRNIVDPELGTVVGAFPLETRVSDPVSVPDSSVGRVFFLVPEGATHRLLAYDPQSLLRVGSREISGVSGRVTRLIRWGQEREDGGGFAFRTDDDRLFLVRTDLVPRRTLTLTLSVEPTAVQGGGRATACVTLSQPAPPGGRVVTLTSERPDVATVAARVVVPAGSVAATFPVTTAAVAQSTTVAIQAEAGGQVAGAGLHLLPPPGSPVRLAGGTTVLRVSLPTRDMVYDRRSRRIYASIPSRVGGIGGSVAAIDPVTGALVSFIPVGSEPGKLALSEDGAYLYVALNGEAAVRRIDLASQAAGLRFSLGNDPVRGPYYGEDMEVAPGQPTVVAVSRYLLSEGQRHAGVVIFDNGVPRGRQTEPSDNCNRIEFSSSPTLLYGCDDERRDGGFRRMTVDASGVSVRDVTFHLVGQYGCDLTFDGGLLFTPDGLMIDPDAREVLGNFALAARRSLSLVAPELDTGRVFYLSDDAWSPEKALAVFDPRTLRLLDSVVIPDVRGTASHLIRWAEDGLAFRIDPERVMTEDDQIILVRL